jgi:hypothetical protein
MNGYPKHVASRTLQEPLEWNNSTLIEGDVAEGVSKLKQQDGKDLLVFRSGELTRDRQTGRDRPCPKTTRLLGFLGRML